MLYSWIAIAFIYLLSIFNCRPLFYSLLVLWIKIYAQIAIETDLHLESIAEASNAESKHREFNQFDGSQSDFRNKIKSVQSIAVNLNDNKEGRVSRAERMKRNQNSFSDNDKQNMPKGKLRNLFNFAVSSSLSNSL